MITQLQMINLILSSGDTSLLTTRGLTSEHFSSLRSEYNFIFNHYKQYGVIPDIQTFLKSFPEFEILDVGDSPEYLISELFRERNEQYLVQTFNTIRTLLVEGKTDEAINVLTNSASKVNSQKHLEAVDILDDISRYETYVDKCQNQFKYYLSTGLRELDDILGGWDMTEDYVTISARSGVGKTWLMLKSVTAAVKRGLNVGVFSGEMSVNKMAYRYDTLVSGISNGMLVHGNKMADKDYSKYLEDLKANHKGHLYILTRDMVDGSVGVNALRGFIEKYNLDILFIDQHSLLDDDHNARQPYERAANISKDIKILQVTKHIPIITVSQQNRTKVDEGKFAGTENIANSDRIAQDSTIILSLTQEDDILTIYIMKSRDGGSFKNVKYHVDLDKGLFEYIPDMDEIGDGDEEYSLPSTIDSDEEDVF